MPQKIKNGTLMIEEGTALPELFPLESEPYFAGWRVVNGYEGIGLDKQLRKSGWTFFYMSAPVRVTVLGFGKGRVLRKAFRKILEIAPTPKFNCFEINEVVSRCFLGFSWVHLSGHAR